MSTRILDSVRGCASSKNRHLFSSRHGVLVLCFVLVILLTLLTWLIISSSQHKLIEFTSLNVANVVARQATTARSVYSSSVVAKLAQDGHKASTNSNDIPGSVPIPAQFLKQLAASSTASSNGLYGYAPLSKWNLSPEQGLSDDFQRWGWAQLEAQNSDASGTAIDWEPVWRIETVDDVKVLRYLYADPAARPSCVSCHNAMEKRPEIRAARKAAGVETGKQWKLHELMGALEVVVPLNESSSFANTQTKNGLLIISAVTFMGLLTVVLFTTIDKARTNSMTTELEYQATHDFLTSLPNRAGFEKNIAKLLRQDDHDQHTHAIMLLDLDDFKRINDTLGHEVGDEVLKEVARRLHTVLDNKDLIARLGGDEFAVLLPGCDEARASQVANQLAAAFHPKICIDEYQLRSGASIGIAVMPKDGSDSKEVLRCADVAMYIAKNAQTDFAFYKPEEDFNHINTLSIITDFKQSLEKGGLSLAYQPKFDIQFGCITGVEALLRWNHPVLGLIPPTEIIPVAERCGLMSNLMQWTLDTALQQLNVWRSQGFDLCMSVNMSAQLLHDLNSIQLIVDSLERCAIAPEHLIIEVTESAMMKDPVCAEEILDKLNSHGVILSVDDFGTGYSSLSYIHRLPIHELKLDRSFISELEPDGKNAVIVNTAIELAHNLDLKIVAEGVEHKPTLDYLKSIDCDIVQGYYLCKPKYADELTTLLPALCKLAVAIGTNRLDKAA